MDIYHVDFWATTPSSSSAINSHIMLGDAIGWQIIADGAARRPAVIVTATTAAAVC
jgi:hypothetical protein